MINYLSHWDINLTQSRGDIAIHLNDSYIKAIEKLPWGTILAFAV